MWSELHTNCLVCRVFSLVCSQSTRRLARFSKIGSETPQGATGEPNAQKKYDGIFAYESFSSLFL